MVHNQGKAFKNHEKVCDGRLGDMKNPLGKLYLLIGLLLYRSVALLTKSKGEML
jgi:hypothetical protein